jgi:hypothetical protein
VFTFIPANTNTGATTLAPGSLTAKNVFAIGAACVGGELIAGVPAVVAYDGTQLNILSSASLGALAFKQTGTGAVTYSANIKMALRFDARDFGATGSGSNESTQIQNLLNAGQNGQIYLGQGKTYVLTTMPVVKGNGTKIIGNNSTFDVADTAGGLDFELSSGTNYLVNVSVEDLAIIANGAGSYGLRVRTSYATFRRVSVALPTGNVAGRGIVLIGQATGTGPYYNTFLNCDVQSASAGTDHIGFSFIAAAGPAFLSPNANTFYGCRAGQCLRNYLIKGNGNTFHGAVAENAALTGTAFYFEGDSATNCQDNHIFGGYIENASKAFEFNANAADNSATGIYGTGVSTWNTDAGTRNYLHTSNGAWSMPQGISFPSGTTNDATTLGKYTAAGSWTPVANSLTIVGTPTYTGTYMKIGRLVFWGLTVASTTTTASTANSTNFTGLSAAAGVPRTVSPTMPAVSSAVAPFSGGYVDTAGAVYTPTWAATPTVYISGVYEATT